MASLAHILNGEVGLSVRNKLNSLIDQYNVPAGFPSGGGTPGSVLFLDASGNMTQDNAHFFWDDSADNLKLLGSLTTLAAVFDGATSGSVTVEAQAVAGSWTMKLPSTAGTNLYVLQTDGTGVTSWVPQSGGGGGGMAIGGSITGATAGSVLFAGAAGVLTQDNANFFWDDTNFFLKIGSLSGADTAAYYLNGLPALFHVPNAAGTNWFEGNAGNTIMSGSGNFGTGDGVLAGLTTGVGNIGIGGSSGHLGPAPTLGRVATGSSNMAVGASALGFTISGVQNTAIGIDAIAQLGSTSDGSFNVGLGQQALYALGATSGACVTNVAIGHAAGSGLFHGQANTLIGDSAFTGVNTGINNTIIGADVFLNTSGDNNWNTIVGMFLGPSSAGNHNELIILCGGRDNAGDNVTALDCGWTTPRTGADWHWSFNTRESNYPVTIHIYNTNDYISTPPTNYERAALDWNVTSNVFRLASQAGGTGTVRLIAIDGFAKAGAPAAGDLPSGSFALIDDTSANQTWLAFNKAGTIRKVQLV